jgi:hypothetical protein
LSRVKIESGDEFELEFEEGDAIIVVKDNGSIRKIYMPEMNTEYYNSDGYKKLLDAIDVLQPGSKEDFIKHHEKTRKKRIH